jgi:hypothetical protein
MQTRNERQSLAFSVERIVLRGQFCKILRSFGGVYPERSRMGSRQAFFAQGTVLTERQKTFRLRTLEEIKLP